MPASLADKVALRIATNSKQCNCDHSIKQAAAAAGSQHPNLSIRPSCSQAWLFLLLLLLPLLQFASAICHSPSQRATSKGGTAEVLLPLALRLFRSPSQQRLTLSALSLSFELSFSARRLIERHPGVPGPDCYRRRPSRRALAVAITLVSRGRSPRLVSPPPGSWQARASEVTKLRQANKSK